MDSDSLSIEAEPTLQSASINLQSDDYDDDLVKLFARSEFADQILDGS